MSHFLTVCGLYLALVGGSNDDRTIDARADVLVVCPLELQPSLRPWLELRQAQGHRVIVQAPAATSYGIKQQIRETAAQAPLRFLMIVGDATTNPGGNAQHCVPTDYVPARVNTRFGSTPEIASDNAFADIDADGLPDLALGRLPVDSRDQLDDLVERIVYYETELDTGIWRRQINFVAGVGGFGKVRDKAIELASKKMITDLIPPEYETTMTYASWTSPYCPDPRQFAETTLERLNEGCLFWVYMGHGSANQLDQVRVPEARYPVFPSQMVDRVECQRSPPIALMLACYTGWFDAANDCLAERLVTHPGGPIACICGSRVTTPYGMSRLGMELVEGYFVDRQPTVGEWMTTAKRQLAAKTVMASDDVVRDDDQPARDNHRQLSDMLATHLSPTADVLEAERAEHIHLMHLLGDPLLRLPQPEAIAVNAAAQASAGEPLVVSGQAPCAGVLTVELVYSRARMRHRPTHRGDFDGRPEALARYQEAYRQANDKLCTRTVVDIPPGPFAVSLDIPADANGECYARVFLQGERSYGIGAAPVTVR
jgi:hypothetical protein